MNMFRRLNPFRRRCCEVLVLAGDHDKPGAAVSGLAQYDGHEFEFVGVALGDGISQDKVGADLDALCAVLVNAGRRGAWRAS